MKRQVTNVWGLLWLAPVLGWMACSIAGGLQAPTLELFEGRVAWVNVHLCGLQPGTCQVSMVLVTPTGDEVFVAVQTVAWVRRGGSFVSPDELRVGDYVTLQAAQLGWETAP